MDNEQNNKKSLRKRTKGTKVPTTTPQQQQQQSDGDVKSSATLDDERKKKEEKEIADWKPGYRTVFRLLLLIRLVSALYNLVWDCDETYNYWEPLHFILYKHGFQTWEYASQYALRSYLYIYLHAIVLLPFKYLGLYKITLFYTLRGAFAFLSAYAEAKLYSTVIKTYNSTIAIYVSIILVSSCGMFLSTTSFLPSSFVIYFICLAYSAWMNGDLKRAVFYIAFSTLVGWPFVALLGVSIAIDAIFIEKKFGKFIKYAAISGLLVGGVQIAVDSYMFGKFVCAPLNIVKYNVFPSGKQGPGLYGEEPVSYYLVNCLLNFNILFPFAIANILIQLFAYKFRFAKFNKYHFLTAVSMYLWLLVFFTRPHKEERFLYPIYPLICLTAAHSVHLITHILEVKLKKIRLLVNLIPLLVLFVHGLFSVLRVLALFKNYSAQMYVFHELDKPKVKYIKALENKPAVNVCIAKEWYRFPSSFFLPESFKRQKWRLKFVKSNFGGQLPNEYAENKNSLVDATRLVDLKKFNDENKEIKERYIDLKHCDFYIDTQNMNDTKVKNEFRDKSKWYVLTKMNFIDVDKSPKWYRAIYIPQLYEENVKFTEFVLFKRS